MKSGKKYEDLSQKILSEAETHYLSARKNRKEVLVKDFTYKDFKKVAAKAPFSLGEWADMLYISERSLHRYANGDGGFNGLQIERILHLEKFIDSANELFGTEGLKNWLFHKPFALNGRMVKDILLTHDGIQEAIDLVGRMQYGIAS